MRVLCIHDDPREPGQGGGAESILRDTTEALRRRRHIVEWWHGQGRISQVIARFRPDICHVQTVHTRMGYEPVIYLQRNHIPHVWVLMDYWPFCTGRMLLKHNDQSCAAVDGVCDGNCDSGPADKRIVRLLNGSFVVALNGYSAEIYRRHGINVGAVIPPGIDTEFFKPDYSRREGVTIAASSAWAGAATKGMHILRQALRIAGLDATVITGVSRERVRDELQKASIYVFPSCYEETYGLCLTEAMACGCACIASDVAGARAQIEELKTGMLFNNRDAQHLADLLVWIVKDQSFRQKLGLNARKMVAKRNSLERLGRDYEQLFEEMIYEQNGDVEPVGALAAAD